MDCAAQGGCCCTCCQGLASTTAVLGTLACLGRYLPSYAPKMRQAFDGTAQFSGLGSGGRVASSGSWSPGEEHNLACLLPVSSEATAPSSRFAARPILESINKRPHCACVRPAVRLCTRAPRRSRRLNHGRPGTGIVVLSTTSSLNFPSRIHLRPPALPAHLPHTPKQQNFNSSKPASHCRIDTSSCKTPRCRPLFHCPRLCVSGRATTSPHARPASPAKRATATRTTHPARRRREAWHLSSLG